MPANRRHDDDGGVYDVVNGWLDTEHIVAIIVLTALALLFLIHRGFRGVNVAGAKLSV